MCFGTFYDTESVAWCHVLNSCQFKWIWGIRNADTTNCNVVSCQTIVLNVLLGYLEKMWQYMKNICGKTVSNVGTKSDVSPHFLQWKGEFIRPSESAATVFVGERVVAL